MKIRSILTIIVFSLIMSALAQQTELRFMYWRMATEPQASILQEIINDFEAQNPDIRIIVEAVPQGQTVDTLTVQALAGSPPDVAVVPQIDLFRFVDMEVVTPLNSFIEDTPGFIENFADYAINMNSRDGIIYGLAHDLAANSLFFNLDLFREAGLPERAPQNYEEFVEFGRALTRPEQNQWAFALFGGKEIGTHGRILGLFWASGVDIISQDGTTVLLDTPEAIAAFQRIIDLHRVEGITTPSPTELDYQTALRLFINGQVAMFQANVGSIAPIQAEAPDMDFMVAPFRWEEVGANIDGSAIIIPEDSRNKEQAWRFITHILSFEGLRDWAVPLSYLPPRTDVTALPEIQSNPYLRTYFDEILPYTNPLPRTVHYTPVMNALNQELSLAILGQKTAEQAARDAAREMRQILDQ